MENLEDVSHENYFVQVLKICNKEYYMSLIFKSWRTMVYEWTKTVYIKNVVLWVPQQFIWPLATEKGTEYK